MKKIGILTIHGVGKQDSEFSREFKEAVTDRLGDDAENFEWQDIFWAELLLDREERLWESMERAILENGRVRSFPLDYRNTREFLVHNVGDALAYSNRGEKNKLGNAYDLIHETVNDSVGSLQQKLKTDSPIVIIAHSMGATIMSDYIWDCQNNKIPSDDARKPIPTHAGFITFGCNIPLFSLNYEFPEPIIFPGDSIKRMDLPDHAVRWLNFVDRDDVLGWPLKAFYESNENLNKQQHATLSKIEDKEINVGSFLTSWNPVSHQKYWTDEDFIRPVVSYLSDLLEELLNKLNATNSTQAKS